jgi:hypothetical protein
MKVSADCSTLFIENNGSTARDFVMQERNMLSHLKLAMLLSVLSTSLLLHSRLSPAMDGQEQSTAGVPIACILFAGAILSIVAGTFEYHYGIRDLLKARAFVAKTRSASIIVQPFGTD